MKAPAFDYVRATSIADPRLNRTILTGVETIEGLSDSGEIADLQKAFHGRNALRCGDCQHSPNPGCATGYS